MLRTENNGFTWSYKKLSSFALKIIAIVTMTIDHIGAGLYPNVDIFRFVGRIAFPLFAFMLVQGFEHTKDDPQRKRKYLARLGIFALISELPYDLFNHGEIYLGAQSIFVLLFLGLVMLYTIDKRQFGQEIAIVICFSIVALLAMADYGATGIFLIYGFYFARNDRDVAIVLCIMAATGMISNPNHLFIYFGYLLAWIPIASYNGKQGKKNKLIQYGFYAYYPVHLLILYAIKMM